MAHHENVRIHGDEVVDRVEQRFALARRRSADVEVDDVGGQALGAISNVVRVRVEFSKKRLKTALPRSSGPSSPRARRWTRRDRPVSSMLRITSAGSPSSVRRCVSAPFALSWGLRIVARSMLFARPSLSRSSSRDSTIDRSWRTVRRAPQYVGSMGSSRPPRSMSTASSMRAGRPKSKSSLIAARTLRPGEEHVVDRARWSRHRR
jgi:hypothetical protein